jgi:hypothetical protein
LPSVKIIEKFQKIPPEEVELELEEVEGAPKRLKVIKISSPAMTVASICNDPYLLIHHHPPLHIPIEMSYR